MPLFLGSTAIASVRRGAEPVQSIMLGDKQIYSAGVKAILTNSTNVLISSLFDPADWANASLKKMVINPLGVTIGSNDNTLAALRTGTGRGGLLAIENYGNIDAAGGTLAHPVGGNALDAEEANIELLNDGLIRSGGGLGGLAGQGGAGTNSTYVDSGWVFNASSYYAYGDGYGNFVFRWAGSNIGTTTAGSITQGIYTYHRGNGMHIKRTYTSTVATTGGLPGNPGRGEGHDGAALAGSPGAAGGTNAGDGGQGGAGGAFGIQGATGADGAAGNNGSGVAGSVGALAGYAIVNSGNVNLTGTGSLLGRT